MKSVFAGLLLHGVYTGITAPFDLVHSLRLVEFVPSGKDDDKDQDDQYELTVHNLGTLEVIKRITSMTNEGWKSLWKGYSLSWLILSIQISIHKPLLKLIQKLSHRRSMPVSVISLILTDVVSGILLSPLEIARTRAMVESYSSSSSVSLSCLVQETFQEIKKTGGLQVLTTSPLVPTVLLKSLLAVLDHGIPTFLELLCGFNGQSKRPLYYWSLKLGFLGIGALIAMPLETVVKRLEWQLASNWGELSATVKTRKRKYSSVWDCVQQIIKEEGSGSLEQGSIYALKGFYRGWRLELLGLMMMATF